MRNGRRGGATTGVLALAALLAGAAGGRALGDESASGPLGCWTTEAGERLDLAHGDDGVLRVVLGGAFETECTTPIETVLVPETGQTCFWAPLCMRGVDAFCLAPGSSADEWTLIRRAWDHSRILRDRSRGSHPLGEVSSEPLRRCP